MRPTLAGVVTVVRRNALRPTLAQDGTERKEFLYSYAPDEGYKGKDSVIIAVQTFFPDGRPVKLKLKYNLLIKDYFKEDENLCEKLKFSAVFDSVSNLNVFVAKTFTLT